MDKVIKKTTYIIEEKQDYNKTKRIDELTDGSQISSTILQSKDKMIINP